MLALTRVAETRLSWSAWTVPTAAAAMGRLGRDVYRPDPARADVYDQLYAEYVQQHDYFGRGANQVMYRLRAIRDRTLGSLSAGDP